MDYAVVNIATSLVENTIVLEEGSNWTPPSGTQIIPLDGNFEIGDTWDGVKFIRAPNPVLETSSGSTPNVIG